jgi:hypothetical protein
MAYLLSGGRKAHVSCQVKPDLTSAYRKRVPFKEVTHVSIAKNITRSEKKKRSQKKSLSPHVKSAITIVTTS